jgi:hypothetical protein
MVLRDKSAGQRAGLHGVDARMLYVRPLALPDRAVKVLPQQRKLLAALWGRCHQAVSCSQMEACVCEACMSWTSPGMRGAVLARLLVALAAPLVLRQQLC